MCHLMRDFHVFWALCRADREEFTFISLFLARHMDFISFTFACLTVSSEKTSTRVQTNYYSNKG